MVDYSLPAGAPPTPPTPPRPSAFDSLKHIASNPAAAVLAILTGISAITTALKTSADNAATDRLAYETLRAESARHGVQIEACRQSLLQQTTWIEELSERLERRQVSTEKAITRKVTKATAQPVPPPVVEPAPKAPPAPAPLEPSALPSFDGLAPREQ
jgi:hypothetical protein